MRDEVKERRKELLSLLHPSSLRPLYPFISRPLPQAVLTHPINRTRMASFTQAAEEIKATLGEMWLPRIYRERILQMRTRSHHLHAQKQAGVEIQHTLLVV